MAQSTRGVSCPIGQHYIYLGRGGGGGGRDFADECHGYFSPGEVLDNRNIKGGLLIIIDIL